MLNIELEEIINTKLNSNFIRDYVPNGLQVEGRREVQRIVTGVTACQALIDNTLIHNADAIIVHHGYFWKNESSLISGIKRQRLKTLLVNDINLYAWHLPLDTHPNLGNNAQLAVDLNIQINGTLEPLVFHGEFVIPLDASKLRVYIEQTLGYNVIHCNVSTSSQIKKLAWCSGSGHKFIELAASAKMDAFISGEISEQAVHIAREYGLHLYAAGHHATERGGIRALGEWLTQQYGLEIIFIDIHNPA